MKPNSSKKKGTNLLCTTSSINWCTKVQASKTVPRDNSKKSKSKHKKNKCTSFNDLFISLNVRGSKKISRVLLFSNTKT